MALRGHVFTKQLFSSDCFALFIDTFLGKSSGIIYGCETTATTDEITVDNGYFCVKGRFLQEEGTTVIPVASSETDVFCKLVCEIDLSKENTVSVLNQAYYKIIEDDTDYPELIQDDITRTSGIYQFEFAKFKRTSEGITNFVETSDMIDFTSIYAEMRRDVNSIIADFESRKEDLFEQLEAESEEEIQDLIDRLRAMLQQLEHDLVPADLVAVDNPNYEATNLDGALTETNTKLNNTINTVNTTINTVNTTINTLKTNLAPKDFTILTTDWTQENEGYTATITDTTVTVNDMADVAIDSTTYTIAEDAGVKSYTVEVAGGIKLFAESVPAGTISGKYTVNRGVANG